MKCASLSLGQPSSAVDRVEPRYRDEAAVLTMQDIAKIYANLGSSSASIAWWTQAANNAWVLWGSCVATRAVVDKLVGALVASGKDDEAGFWQSMFPMQR